MTQLAERHRAVFGLLLGVQHLARGRADVGQLAVVVLRRDRQREDQRAGEGQAGRKGEGGAAGRA